MAELVVNYPTLMEVAERLASGTWDPVEAQSWLVAANDLVQDEADRIVDLVQETGYYQESPDELEVGLTALQDFQECIGLLWEFLQEGAEGLLREAVGLAAGADDKIRQALLLNAEVRGGLTFEAYC